MTTQRSFKRLVRARMEKTGESYTAARARLLAGDEPQRISLATSDEMIRERTGRGWEEWFDLLDEWGAADKSHREIARLYEAFVDPILRERWLPDGDLRERTTIEPRSARFDWGDGASRVHVAFASKGDAKSTAALSHERLPDGAEAARMKAFWRERVAGLKQELEA